MSASAERGRAAREVEDGLVDDDELVPLERVLDVADDPCVDRRGDEDGLVARVALRRVHLAVGASQKLLARGSVVRVYGPPDAPVDLDRGAVDAERPAECIPQPADERAGPIVAPRAHREHHELVAADAGDGVRLAHDCLESAGERSQHGIPGTVTADVVDVLEAVEVDHDERERLARAA